MDIIFKKHNSVCALSLHIPLTCLCQYSNSSSAIMATSSPPSNESLKIPRCRVGLNPMFRYLCNRRAAWGIVLEVLASSGFHWSVGLVYMVLSFIQETAQQYRRYCSIPVHVPVGYSWTLCQHLFIHHSPHHSDMAHKGLPF